MTELSEEQKRNLANDWGPAATHSDYKPGDILRYRLPDGSTCSGVVVWVTGPSESHVIGRDDNLPLRYICERTGWEGSIPDVVYQGDILQGTDEEPTEGTVTLDGKRFLAYTLGSEAAAEAFLNETKEPAMRKCDYCGQYHYVKDGEFYCPLDPNRPL